MTPEEQAAAKLAEDEAAKIAADEAAKLADKEEPELDDDGNPIVLEPELEPWMKEDGEQDLDDPSKQVPVGKFVSVKKKLKGQISDRDEEIERLRRERDEALKQKPKPETVLVRPKKIDFDTDEEFDEAFDKYSLNRTEETINRTRLEDQQKVRQQQAQQKLVEAVDGHYERAEKLIGESGITPEVYKVADTTVRAAVEAINPNLGDVIVDQVISILGDGSEKVLYYLGRNKVALAKFQNLLATDKSGMKAAVYLGQEKQRLTKPIKPRSNAPNPVVDIKGDEVLTGAEGRYKKKYDAAKGNLQKAYNIRKEAKAANVDVSTW